MRRPVVGRREQGFAAQQTLQRAGEQLEQQPAAATQPEAQQVGAEDDEPQQQ